MQEEEVKVTVGRKDRLHLQLRKVEDKCAEFWVVDSGGVGRATVPVHLTAEGYSIGRVTQYANQPDDRVDAIGTVKRVLSVERLERILGA